MLLIVGLGNYGLEYSKTKHNCGFMLLDKIAIENGVEISKKRCKSLICECHILGEKVVLAKPLTYMNSSGEAVHELIKAYKPDNLLVCYDDVDLPFGTIRYREKGSAGTHNGMRSVVEFIGENFSRLRIGIKPEENIYNLADYVLTKIDKKYVQAFENSLEIAYLKVVEFIKNKGKN